MLYTKDRDRVPQKQAVCTIEEMLALLNDCGVLSWDGFSGDNPRGVMDGYMFAFKATENGDRAVRANGSNNYPRHYHKFLDEIEKRLATD